MSDKLTERDVELAERYAAALRVIEDADAVSEVDVERAERRAAAMQVIEGFADLITGADVELAERYATALQTAHELREDMSSPFAAYIRSLSDEQLLAELESARAEMRAEQRNH